MKENKTTKYGPRTRTSGARYIFPHPSCTANISRQGSAQMVDKDVAIRLKFEINNTTTPVKIFDVPLSRSCINIEEFGKAGVSIRGLTYQLHIRAGSGKELHVADSPPPLDGYMYIRARRRACARLATVTFAATYR